jgi:nicotinamide phosphoribosyltransferase
MYGLNEIVSNIFSIKITMDIVDEAEGYAKAMGLKFTRVIWERVVNECKGFLQLEIQCVPDGTWCPKGTPFAQVRNTVEGFGEMVTWLEAPLLQAAFATACATRAMEMRSYLDEKMAQYSFDSSFLWHFHSFGLRGHRSMEDAYWAGTAWKERSSTGAIPAGTIISAL